MKIKKFSVLSAALSNKIQDFISTNTFNNSISFFENDYNYYEDFPSFYMLYDKNILIAFLSVFIPDATSCEIYFHFSDDKKAVAGELFSMLYSSLRNELESFSITERYILFDIASSADTIKFKNLQPHFSHSEYLMCYDLEHKFILDEIRLTCNVISDNDTIIINTFKANEFIGKCEAEVSDTYAIIHDVEINENERGLGYGKELLYHTIEFLTDNEYKNILLHVNSANTIAYTMYSHYGFKIKEQIDYWLI